VKGNDRSDEDAEDAVPSHQQSTRAASDAGSPTAADDAESLVAADDAEVHLPAGDTGSQPVGDAESQAGSDASIGSASKAKGRRQRAKETLKEMMERVKSFVKVCSIVISRGHGCV
jgi:hypothetical protein